MEEKKRIAPAAIVAAALVLLTIMAMALPLYSIMQRVPVREYNYYFGRYYNTYEYRYMDYSFFEALELAFDNMDELWGVLIVGFAALTGGALAFSIISIFKRKAGIGACLCAGIGANALLVAAVSGSGIDAPGVGGVLMFLLMLTVMILTIVVASKKPKKAPAAVTVVPVAPVATLCPNCHNVLPAGSVACNVCGTMIAAPAAPVAPAATQFCAGCGAPLEAGMSFCRSCGRPVPPPVPTSYQ